MSMTYDPTLYKYAPEILVRTALTTASGLIGDHGWMAGAYQHPGIGLLCCAGAINLATTAKPHAAGVTAVHTMDPAQYFTIQATKRAFVLHLAGDPCPCSYCFIPPAAALVRDLESIDRMGTDYYDNRIAHWNDNRCRDGAEAVAKLLGVPDELISDAVADEFPNDKEPTTDRRLHRLVEPQVLPPAQIKYLKSYLAGSVYIPSKSLTFA